MVSRADHFLALTHICFAEAHPKMATSKRETLVAVSSVGYGLTRQYLSSAQDALFVGNTLTGRRMAAQALARGIDARDTHMEAEASLVLGQACVLDSRMRSARRFGSRALSFLSAIQMSLAKRKPWPS
jgi:hypothetical protein